MNDFSSIQNNGLLKVNYGDYKSPAYTALKQRREKLYKSKTEQTGREDPQEEQIKALKEQNE